MDMPQACAKFSTTFQAHLLDHTKQAGFWNGPYPNLFYATDEKGTLAAENADLEKKAKWAVALRKANAVTQALLLSQDDNDWEILELTLEGGKKAATKVG
eukprot:TRINITY_DN66657_c5_g3_i1.p2 TRINITY_DN66657_c5_g3~~TRINITY_DN66657_c5_g3_i1.p2  ORF type:complete len:100 (+),score=21.43 TRINITY_DN66657_c5_g3_i1:119-418(+)